MRDNLLFFIILFLCSTLLCTSCVPKQRKYFGRHDYYSQKYGFSSEPRFVFNPQSSLELCEYSKADSGTQVVWLDDENLFFRGMVLDINSLRLYSQIQSGETYFSGAFINDNSGIMAFCEDLVDGEEPIVLLSVYTKELKKIFRHEIDTKGLESLLHAEEYGVSIQSIVFANEQSVILEVSYDEYAFALVRINLINKEMELLLRIENAYCSNASWSYPLYLSIERFQFPNGPSGGLIKMTSSCLLEISENGVNQIELPFIEGKQKLLANGRFLHFSPDGGFSIFDHVTKKHTKLLGDTDLYVIGAIQKSAKELLIFSCIDQVTTVYSLEPETLTTKTVASLEGFCKPCSRARNGKCVVRVGREHHSTKLNILNLNSFALDFLERGPWTENPRIAVNSRDGLLYLLDDGVLTEYNLRKGKVLRKKRVKFSDDRDLKLGMTISNRIFVADPTKNNKGKIQCSDPLTGEDLGEMYYKDARRSIYNVAPLLADTDESIKNILSFSDEKPAIMQRAEKIFLRNERVKLPAQLQEVAKTEQLSAVSDNLIFSQNHLYSILTGKLWRYSSESHELVAEGGNLYVIVYPESPNEETKVFRYNKDLICTGKTAFKDGFFVCDLPGIDTYLFFDLFVWIEARWDETGTLPYSIDSLLKSDG